MSPNPADPTLVYVTAPDRDEAGRIAAAVIEERLAACANLLDNVSSIFRWNGEICREQECVLILKTTKKQTEALTDRIRIMHPYECPCIVTLPITGGHRPFLDWIACGGDPS